MKRKVWITLLLVLTAALSLVAFASCKPKNPGPNVDVSGSEGAETGTYYFDASEGDEYDLSLSNGNRFTLLMREINRAGDYTLDGEKLTLMFSKPYEETIEARLAGKVITLTYNGLEMRFLKKEYYTVSFDTHGGNAISSLTVINGKTLGKIDDPVKEGSYFLGWYMDAEYQTPFLFGTQPVTGEMTLHARWGEGIGTSGFKVNFNLNYDGAPQWEEQETVGGRIFDLKDPVRDGWTFIGWYVSQYDDPAQLSYAVDTETIFKEDVTLYANWEQKSTNAGKLPTPRVTINESGISWNAVGANSYTVKVTGPSGFTAIENGTTTSTNYPVDFKSAPAGDYTVSVLATTTNTANNANEVVLHWKNKALAKVSLFEVVAPSTLLFNAVENANEYILSIDCGNKKHDHSALSNGNSTYYNFANCTMQPGGIKFRVTARANGYSESVSKEFAFEQNLGVVTNIRVNEATQTLVWDPVENATNYVLSIACSDTNHNHGLVDVGNATSYSLKECGRGEITVNIYAKTKGYNSPEPVTFTYNKPTIGTPTNFRLLGTVLSWDPVANAASYVVRIGGKAYSTNESQYDLSKITDLEWVVARDYVAEVQAQVGDDPNANSLYSDAIDMRYFALSSSLQYTAGVLSWRHVIGVTYYEVQINGTSMPMIENGENSVRVKLTRAGVNTLSVRFYDDEANMAGSDWATMEVFANTIEFDTRGGEPVPNMYVVYGDKLDLPTTTRPGFTFDAWYNTPGGAEKNGAKIDSEYYLQTGDSVFFAGWDSMLYTVKYVYGDSRDEDPNKPHTDEVYFGKNFQFIVPDAPNSSVVFLGWYSKKDGRGTRFTDQNGKSLITWNVLENEAPVYAYFAKLLQYTLMKAGEEDAYYSVSAGPGLVLVDEVTIPGEYEGIPVKAIPGYAFLNATSLRKIRIPDTVTNIGGKLAFQGCSRLESFEIYAAGAASQDIVYRTDSYGVISELNSGTAWTLAIYPMGRTGDYTMPSDITELRDGIFAGTKISKIVIPASVTNIYNEAFMDCNYLREVVFENATESSAELTIYTRTFVNCTSLRSVTFPTQLKTFGQTASADSGSDSVNNGKANVFVNCPRLETINMVGTGKDFSAAEGMLAYKGNLIYVPETLRVGSLSIPAGVTGIGDYLFSGSTVLTQLEVPGWVTYIGVESFYNNDSLRKVTFKASASGVASELEIARRAFASCDVLTDVIFEEGSNVTKIGELAFYRLIYMEKLELPETLEVLGPQAFQSCFELKEVTFRSGGTKLEIGMEVFSECSALTKIQLPKHVSKIEYGSFEGISTNDVTVEDGGDHYISRDGAIYGLNDSKQEVDLTFFSKSSDFTGKLPETLQKIGSYVFRGNVYLTKLEIPASVTYIGTEAFKGATGLTEITFKGSNNITFDGIGTATAGDAMALAEGDATGLVGSTFEDCTALETLKLPKGVTTLPGRFLYMTRKGASQLTDFDMPDSLVQIGGGAFYHSNILDVEIPKNVTTIGNEAFYEANMIGLTFKSGSQLSVIGDSAFRNTRINKLDLPDTVTSLGSYAFADTRITTVKLGSKVTTAGSNVFMNCTSLTSVSISSDIETNGMFSNCSSLNSVTFSDGVKVIPSNAISGTSVQTITIAKSIETISENAFYQASQLTNITFANKEQSNLETIGDHAFEGAGITVIDLPKKVETIGASAFAYDYSLTSATLPKSVESIGENAFNYSGLTSIKFEGGTSSNKLTIAANAFGGTSLTSFEIPANCESISSLAFGNRQNSLAKNIKLTLENSAKYLELESGNVLYNKGKTTLLFALPSKNGDMSVPSSVKRIEDGAFERSAITKFTVNGSNNGLVIGSEQSIKDGKATNVFLRCSALTEVNLGSGVKEIGANAFEYCTALTKVEMSGGVQKIDEKAFTNCSALSTLTLCDSIEEIGASAFNSCSALTGQDGVITLPKSLKTIGASAFSGCTNANLKEIKFPESSTSYTEIDPNAFKGVFSSSAAEAKIEIPDYVTKIGDNAFNGCNVKTITFENSSKVDEIGSYAFSSTKISEIKIPASVTKIHSYAFSGCKQLSKVEFEEDSGNGKILSMGEPGDAGNYNANAYVFNNCSALTEIELPTRLQNIGYYLFYGCSTLTKVELPSGMTRVPSGMFYGCTALNEIEWPSAGGTAGGANSFTTIGSYAFYGCIGFAEKDFKLPETVTTLESYAFGNFAAKSFSFGGENDGDSSLAEIGANAFRGANITEFDFTKTNLKEIGNNAFRSSKATKITLNGIIDTIGNNAFRECTDLTTFSWGSGESKVDVIGDGAFFGCTGLTGTFELPRFLESLGGPYTPQSATGSTGLPVNDPDLTYSLIRDDTYGPGRKDNVSIGVFHGCTGITAIDFNDNLSLQTIGTGAFFGCTGLKNLELPDSVTTICNYAFADSGLETVTIPASLDYGPTNEYILINGEIRCTNLKEFKMEKPSNYYSVKNGVLYDANGETLIAYPAGRPVDKNEDGEIDLAKFTSLFDGVKTVYRYAFEGANLTGVDLDLSKSDVNTIGEHAFFNCGVKSLAFGVIESGGNQAYGDNANLESISFADGTKTLGNVPFKRDTGCPKLKTIKLPEGLERISANFLVGTAVEEITVPASVRYFGQNEASGDVTALTGNAFMTSTLKTVTFEERGADEPLEIYGSGNFKETAITEIELPEGTVFPLNTNGLDLENLQGSTVQIQGTSLFENCKKLTKLTLPKSINLIPTSFVQGCSALKELIIPDGVTLEFVGGYAFVDCSSLTSFGAKEGEEDKGLYLNTRIFGFSTNGIYSAGIINGSGIKKITFGDRLSSIAGGVFDSSALEEIDLSEATNEVKMRRPLIRSNRALKKITFPSGNFDAGDIFGYDGRTPNPLIYGCANLEEIVLNGSLTEVPGYLTYSNANTAGLAKLKKVTLPTKGKITAIREGAFSGIICPEFTIEIPSTVTAIEANAFMNSSIKTISLPEKLNEIGDQAFANSTLTEINVPSSVRLLGKGVFSGCASLTKVEGLDNATEIPENMFYGCEKLTQIPSNMTKVSAIGPNAFFGCKALKNSVSFTAVSSLGNAAFSDCAEVTSLTLSNVTNIPSEAFKGCGKLTSVTVSSALDSVGSSAFEGCTALNNFELGSASTIGSRAFFGCSTLDKLTFKSVTTIGDSAFENCTKLSSVTLNNGCRPETIGKRAFFDCKALSTMNLGESLLSIGDEAFAGCTSLSSLKIPDTITSIGQGAFQGVKQLTGLNGSSKNDYYKIENSVLYDKDGKTLISYNGNGDGKFTIPETVESITPYAFAQSNLTEVTIGKGLKVIGDYAFAGATKLTKIDFNGSNVTQLGGKVSSGEEEDDGRGPGMYPGEGGGSNQGGNVFANCTQLKELTIPSSVTKLTAYVFANSSLTKVEFQGEITELPNYAFQNAKFTEFTIGDKITRLGNGVFQNCTELTKIEGGKGVTELGSYCFDGCKALEDLSSELWEDLTYIDQYAFRGCKKLDQNDFANKMDSMPGYWSVSNNAFEGTGISSLEWIPSTWTGINSGWFANTQLKDELKLPENITYVGNAAFAGTEINKFTVTTTNQFFFSSSWNLFDGIKSSEFELVMSDTVAVGGGYAMFANLQCENEFTLKITGLGNLTYFSQAGYDGTFSDSACKKITITVEGGSELVGFNQYGFEDPKAGAQQNTYAFNYCQNLEEIVLPDTITFFGGNEFSSSAKLKTLKIPANLKAIGANAFSGCSGFGTEAIADTDTPESKPNAVLNFNGLEWCAGFAFVGLNNRIIVIDAPATTYQSWPRDWNYSNRDNGGSLIFDSEGNNITNMHW